MDRSALDRIIQAGGYISVRTGQAPEAHSVLVSKDAADLAFDAAQCIGIFPERQPFDVGGRHDPWRVDRGQADDGHLGHAIVEERERLAQELHDDLGQLVSYVNVQVQAAADQHNMHTEVVKVSD